MGLRPLHCLKESPLSKSGGQRLAQVHDMKEEEKIRAAVKERKQRAKELGIVATVFELFDKNLRHFSSNPDSPYLPEGAKVVRDEKSKDLETFILHWEDKQFTFLWFSRRSECFDDGRWVGILSLRVAGEKVLEFDCVCKPDKDGTAEWKVSNSSDVEAFIEGSWVEEITRFASTVKKIEEQIIAEFNEAEKVKELSDLKKRFGVP